MPAVKHRPRFSGIWLCKTAHEPSGKPSPNRAIAKFFIENRQNTFFVFMRCARISRDPDDIPFISYAFDYQYWLRPDSLRRHALGFSKRHTYQDRWRAVGSKSFEVEIGNAWERFVPTTLAELKKRGFDMMQIAEYYADARRLGWRYSLKARLPSFPAARLRKTRARVNKSRG